MRAFRIPLTNIVITTLNNEHREYEETSDAAYLAGFEDAIFGAVDKRTPDEKVNLELQRHGYWHGFQRGYVIGVRKGPKEPSLVEL